MSSISRRIKSPYLALTLVPLIWSSNFVLGKLLVGVFPPFTLTTGRFGMAFLCLLPVYLYQRKKQGPQRISLKTWGLLIFLGIIGVFGFNTLLYTGLQQTTPVNATLINGFNPTLTILLSIWILGEKLRGKQIIGFLLSFAGVAWIAVQGQPARLSSLAVNRGDMLILLGALVWAIYSVGVKKAAAEVSPLALTTLTMFFGLLALLPTAYVELTVHPLGRVTGQNIIALIYLGLFPAVIAFLLWNWGIAQVGPGKAAMFYNLIPPFAAVMSYFAYGEIPKGYHLLGGTLVLWGVIWGTKRYENKAAQVTSPNLKMGTHEAEN